MTQNCLVKQKGSETVSSNGKERLELAKEIIKTQNPFRLLGVTNEEIKEIREEIDGLTSNFCEQFAKSPINSTHEIKKLAADLVEFSVFLSLLLYERINNDNFYK